MFSAYKTKSKKLPRGFTLIEIMIVIALIGILSRMALSSFKSYQAKAKQSEAKVNLKSVGLAEQAYQAENDTYIPISGGLGLSTDGSGHIECSSPDFDKIGFSLGGGKNCGQVRYWYTVIAPDAAHFTADAKTASGTKNPICPGAAQSDEMTLDQDMNLMPGGPGGGKDTATGCK